jgi:hypothetical protein
MAGRKTGEMSECRREMILCLVSVRIASMGKGNGKGDRWRGLQERRRKKGVEMNDENSSKATRDGKKGIEERKKKQASCQRVCA